MDVCISYQHKISVFVEFQKFSLKRCTVYRYSVVSQASYPKRFDKILTMFEICLCLNNSN